VGASDAGGSIRVSPAALVGLAGRLQTEAGRTEQAVADGSGRACVTTGCPQVDAALASYTAAWSTQVQALATATKGLSQSVAAAAADYETTDAAAMPITGAVP